MPNRALSTAASGMYAQQLNIEVISNNIANINTTGFKKNKAEFQDLMYQNVNVNQVTSPTQSPDGPSNTVIQIGDGVQPVANQKIFKQGDVTQTNNQLDMAIQGDGFFQVQKPGGGYGYQENSSR